MLAVALFGTFAAYARTLRFQFIYDDQLIIIQNPAIHSWRYFPQYFTKHFWAGPFPDIQSKGNYYRPLYLIWLRLNDAAFGSHAGAWHLALVLLHVLVTLLVYFLTKRMLKDRWIAAWAALLFGLHPVHIDSVAWASGSTDVLLAVFQISAFLCYLRAREAGRKRPWKGLSLVFYALALLDKEIAIVLPALVFVYEWLFGNESATALAVDDLGGRIKRSVRSAIPYLIVTIPYLAARAAVVARRPGIQMPLPLSAVLFTWPSLFWFWITHLFWPVGLSIFYDVPPVNHPGLRNFVLPGLAAAVVIGLIAWWGWRRREAAFAAAWLVLPLLPFLEIRWFVQSDYAHDWHLYVPSIGFVIIAACGLQHILNWWMKRGNRPAVPVLVALALAALLGCSTFEQTAWFHDDLVFAEHNARAVPGNPYGRLYYGVQLGKAARYTEAANEFRGAIAADPGNWSAYYNLGLTDYKLHRWDEAERCLKTAASMNPRHSGSFFYLGLAELNLNRLEEAGAAIRQAIVLQSDGYGYHFALGIILRLQGDLPGALEQFRAELKANPGQPSVERQIAEIEEAGRAKTPGAHMQ